MVIYLKSGQAIDMGNVTHAYNECNRELKPFKLAEDNDECIGVENIDMMITIYNDNNELLQVNNKHIVAIREEVK